MSNIVNKSRDITPEEQQMVDDLLQQARILASAVLDRPTCGCEKTLCSHCRRDKHEVAIAKKLIALMEAMNE